MRKAVIWTEILLGAYGGFWFLATLSGFFGRLGSLSLLFLPIAVLLLPLGIIGIFTVKGKQLPALDAYKGNPHLVMLHYLVPPVIILHLLLRLRKSS